MYVYVYICIHTHIYIHIHIYIYIGGLLLGLGLCAYNAVMVASDVSHWAQSAEDRAGR